MLLEYISIIFSIKLCVCLSERSNSDSNHLILKNVNFAQNQLHGDKLYDVLDLSVLLPKNSIQNHLSSILGKSVNLNNIQQNNQIVETKPTSGQFWSTVTSHQRNIRNQPNTHYQHLNEINSNFHQKNNKFSTITTPRTYLMNSTKSEYEMWFGKTITSTPQNIIRLKENLNPTVFYDTNEIKGSLKQNLTGGSYQLNLTPRFEALRATKGPINFNNEIYITTTTPKFDSFEKKKIKFMNFDKKRKKSSTGVKGIRKKMKQERNKLLPSHEMLLNTFVYHDVYPKKLTSEKNTKNWFHKSKPPPHHFHENCWPAMYKNKVSYSPFVIKVEERSKRSISQDPDLNTTSSSTDSIRFKQDIFIAQNTPHELEFGHVAETPKGWEERFERINTKMLRHQGKIRWISKDGEANEQYWDFG